MYIHTIDNHHTIKHESLSFVVGEAEAYEQIFKPISPCKNNWEFVCRSETIIYYYNNYYNNLIIIVPSSQLTS